MMVPTIESSECYGLSSPIALNILKPQARTFLQTRLKMSLPFVISLVVFFVFSLPFVNHHHHHLVLRLVAVVRGATVEQTWDALCLVAAVVAITAGLLAGKNAFINEREPSLVMLDFMHDLHTKPILETLEDDGLEDTASCTAPTTSPEYGQYRAQLQKAYCCDDESQAIVQSTKIKRAKQRSAQMIQQCRKPLFDPESIQSKCTSPQRRAGLRITSEFAKRNLDQQMHDSETFKRKNRSSVSLTATPSKKKTSKLLEETVAAAAKPDYNILGTNSSTYSNYTLRGLDHQHTHHAFPSDDKLQLHHETVGYYDADINRKAETFIASFWEHMRRESYREMEYRTLALY